MFFKAIFFVLYLFMTHQIEQEPKTDERIKEKMEKCLVLDVGGNPNRGNPYNPLGAGRLNPIHMQV